MLSEGPVEFEVDFIIDLGFSTVDGGLVTTAGIEPATYSLGNCRSIQLSYVVMNLKTLLESTL